MIFFFSRILFFIIKKDKSDKEMSSIDTLTWQEFCKEALKFLEISKQLDDTWSWEEKVITLKNNTYLSHLHFLSESTSRSPILP